MEFKVGMQLYSLRDDMAVNVEKTLKSVKEADYDGVEFAGFYDKTPNEIKDMLDEIGLECFSAHISYEAFLENPESFISYFKVLRNKFAVVPSIDLSKDFHVEIAKIIRVVNILKQENIEVLFHNHWAEFGYLDGELILDKILADGIIKAELDIAWARFAGVDVAEYITKKLSGILPILHVKDFKSTAHFKDGDKFDKSVIPLHHEVNFSHCVLGEGVVDIAEAIESAKQAGCKILIVERDEANDITPIESARLGRQYLKSIGY